MEWTRGTKRAERHGNLWWRLPKGGKAHRKRPETLESEREEKGDLTNGKRYGKQPVAHLFSQPLLITAKNPQR